MYLLLRVMVMPPPFLPPFLSLRRRWEPKPREDDWQAEPRTAASQRSRPAASASPIGRPVFGGDSPAQSQPDRANGTSLSQRHHPVGATGVRAMEDRVLLALG